MKPMAAPSGTPKTKSPDRTLGFRSMDEEVRVERLDTEGRIPDWLEGSLIRVTPALLDVGGQPLTHWFDGLAMLNSFSFSRGKVSYGSRFLDTEAHRSAREGSFDSVGFGQDPCRNLFQRVQLLFDGNVNDNCNVNLVKLGERCLAMTEVPLPVAFDSETLETQGLVRWKDRLGGHASTAHPHHDPVTGELVNYVAHFSARPTYRVFAVGPGSRDKRREIARVPVREPSYMHSFAMTERYVVLTEFPLVVNPIHMIRGGAFIDHYRWEPDRGTRFTIVDRHSGEVVARPEAPAFFCFHHVNAFERDREIVVDLVAYDDAEVIDRLRLGELRNGTRNDGGELRRYRVPLGAGEVTSEPLSDAGVELPRTDYGRVNGSDYRYVYAAETTQGSNWFDALAKIDVSDGSVSRWSRSGTFVGEPVFVPSPDSQGEDDGVLLSVDLDPVREVSSLVVIDAGTMEELGRAEGPHAIPFGFHGEYF